MAARPRRPHPFDFKTIGLARCQKSCGSSPMDSAPTPNRFLLAFLLRPAPEQKGKRTPPAQNTETEASGLEIHTAPQQNTEQQAPLDFVLFSIPPRVRLAPPGTGPRRNEHARARIRKPAHLPHRSGQGTRPKHRRETSDDGRFSKRPPARATAFNTGWPSSCRAAHCTPRPAARWCPPDASSARLRWPANPLPLCSPRPLLRLDARAGGRA
jgi:hypothetical protein